MTGPARIFNTKFIKLMTIFYQYVTVKSAMSVGGLWQTSNMTILG